VTNVANKIMRKGFDQGYEAFTRTFPQIAEKLEFRPFYVCPLCLVAGSENALEQGWLTREDVPPRSVGGRKIVLTCKPCNDRAGHEIDCHARHESNIMSFLTREKAEMRAHLRSASGRVPIQLKVSDSGIQAVVVPKAVRKTESDAVNADFGRAALSGGWQDFTFNVEFAAFSQPRAATSWLRTAYLAFFATLGYRFIFRRELDVVRARIKNPESKEPSIFRLMQHKAAPEPTLICVERPEVFRSYLMLYGRNAVFLPRYGDRELYTRLAAKPACDVTFSGMVYPWPDLPRFLHDFVPQQPRDQGRRQLQS
jgi:hypothetical protein